MKAKDSACPKCGELGDYHFPCCANVPKGLDAIADAVLRYKPPAKAKATKRREKRRAKLAAKKG